jgi:hypothetical protein
MAEDRQVAAQTLPDFARAVRWPIDAADVRLRMSDRMVSRLPVIARRAGDRVATMPAGSRTRRWIFTRLVTAGFAASGAEDWSYLKRLYAEDVVLRNGGGVPLDFPSRLVGWDQLQTMLTDFRDAVRGVEFRPVELLDAGGPFLGARVHIQMSGRASGAEVSQDIFSLYEFVGGRATKQWQGGTLDQALELMTEDLAYSR